MVRQIPSFGYSFDMSLTGTDLTPIWVIFRRIIMFLGIVGFPDVKSSSVAALIRMEIQTAYASVRYCSYHRNPDSGFTPDQSLNSSAGNK